MAGWLPLTSRSISNVIPNPQCDATAISFRLRLVAAVLGASLLAVCFIALRLEPDARGQGTHQQLGLPPCTFMMLFNIRCPACGMTTAWSNVVRGRLPSALRANVAGTLLAVAGALAGPWLLISAAMGRWLWRVPSQGVLAALVVVLMIVMLSDWTARLIFR